MKNNIIKDDREISMKTASFSTDISDDAGSIATDNNLLTDPTEALEMNTNTLTDLPNQNAQAHPLEMVEPNGLPSAPAIEQITEPMTLEQTEPIVDPAVALESTQTELTAMFENAKSTATEFFNNNRSLLITLGWIVLAIFGIKVVFATLGIIDDIPLITPIIKIVGLVSVVRFAWRYLIREHDRQELIEILDRKKVEVLGEHN
jgi:CAAD domains of cyanobacterial aminoacyl-tRNA synthetase